MPGKLKLKAWCPMCGKDIASVVRISGFEHTVLQFFHSDDTVSCNTQGAHGDMDRLYARLHEE